MGLRIGSLLFAGIDQIDLTGPFEVLSRLPDAEHRVYGVAPGPVQDVNGLLLLAHAPIEEAPALDVLHIPGGRGQEALMENARVLDWITHQARHAQAVLSVCTGALLCGAAGLLRGRHATTHWSAHHLLPLFGAISVNARVVTDGRFTFAAGVTAGIDGALALAATLCGEAVAQQIQLAIAYAPEPPFDAGTPERAPASVRDAARDAVATLTAQREVTARRVATRLGIDTSCAHSL